jgi:hypothetical protein
MLSQSSGRFTRVVSSKCATTCDEPEPITLAADRNSQACVTQRVGITKGGVKAQTSGPGSLSRACQLISDDDENVSDEQRSGRDYLSGNKSKGHVECFLEADSGTQFTSPPLLLDDSAHVFSIFH